MASQPILIVDDTPTNLQVLCALLSDAGFEVAIAQTGEMALEILDMIEPQMVLLDVMMPGIDGYETCRRFKENPRTAHIPVIFMSALSEGLNKVKAFEVGAVDYITKPIDTSETLARVRHHLEFQAAQSGLAQLNRELEERVEQRTAALVKEAEERHRASAQFRSIFSQAPIGMAVTDAKGEFVDVNQSLCEVLGHTKTELLELSWHHFIHPDEKKLAMLSLQQLAESQINNFKTELRCVAKDGEEIHGLLQAASVQGERDHPTYLISQFMDLTHRKQVEAELRHNANHDDLTGLPNRAFICQRLDDVFEMSRHNPDHCFALLFLDLNRFKVVNDSLGHHIGDRLLVAIARRLETTVRDSDIVARLGGDEFVVLLQEIRSLEDAVHVAERINTLLKKPFDLGLEQPLFTSASIGIAQGTAQYETADELLRNADIAMYTAKAQGRKGDYIIFDRGMYEQVSGKLQLELDLRHALEAEQFQLHYQPIVSTDTGALLGFEALVRWFSPEKGMVSPADFIPIAEETGLIVPLGEWILQEAMEQLLRWRKLSPQAQYLKMSVNLSIQQLKSPDFLQRLDFLLDLQDWNRQGLQLEITESIFMEDLEELLALLQALKQRGIELALDDFGTGYSCLSYLHRFPLDHLKVDRAFVSDIGLNGENSEIAAMVINLAHHLGMGVIAEGIEEPHQREHLLRMGCPAAQGYWFSKPLNAEAAEKIVLEPLPWREQIKLPELAA